MLPDWFLAGVYGMVPELIREMYDLFTPKQMIERSIAKLSDSIEQCNASISKHQKEYERVQRSIPTIARSDKPMDLKELELYSAIRQQRSIKERIRLLYDTQERLSMAMNNHENAIVLQETHKYIQMLLKTTESVDIEGIQSDMDKVDENLYIAKRQNEDAMSTSSPTMDAEIQEEVRRLLGTSTQPISSHADTTVYKSNSLKLRTLPI